MSVFAPFKRSGRVWAWAISVFILPLSGSAQSLDIPSSGAGISFGNSTAFTGLRFNYRDRDVDYVNGINVTLWKPHESSRLSRIKGLSIGTLPGGGSLSGLQLGALGIAAETNVTGISFALLGIGGGAEVKGISIAGLGLGSGGIMTGVNLGGLGVGAGGVLSGITLAGLGAGGRSVKGLTMAGITVAGKELNGVQLALGTVRVVDDGRMSLFSASAFNHIQGTQSGLSIGLVNYARRLKGLQLGVINIVRDNRKSLRVLPLFNADFH